MTTSPSGARAYTARIDYFSHGDVFATESFVVPLTQGEAIRVLAEHLSDHSVYSHPDIPGLMCVITLVPTTPDDPHTPPPSAPPQQLRCRYCGDPEISREAVVRWDVATQSWVLFAAHSRLSCENCGAEGNAVAIWVPADEPIPAPPRPDPFLQAVAERLGLTSLAEDETFRRFCSAAANITVDQAAALWRRQYPDES